MEWEPIETAPLDGTVIELTHREWPKSILGSWKHGEWHPVPEQRVWTLGREIEIPDPTYWRSAPDYKSRLYL